jgi:hypothetical protein
VPQGRLSVGGRHWGLLAQGFGPHVLCLWPQHSHVVYRETATSATRLCSHDVIVNYLDRVQCHGPWLGRLGEAGRGRSVTLAAPLSGPVCVAGLRQVVEDGLGAHWATSWSQDLTCRHARPLSIS